MHARDLGKTLIQFEGKSSTELERAEKKWTGTIRFLFQKTTPLATNGQKKKVMKHQV